MAVIVLGRLVALGTPAELTAQHSGAVVSFRLPARAAVTDLPALGGALVPEGGGWQLATTAPAAALHTLTTWALERNVELPSLTVHRPTLEDVYLSLVGADTPAPADDSADTPAGRRPR